MRFVNNPLFAFYSLGGKYSARRFPSLKENCWSKPFPGSGPEGCPKAAPKPITKEPSHPQNAYRKFSEISLKVPGRIPEGSRKQRSRA